MEGKWLSVLEFAAYKKKSISTVRRYIKANRVKHKEESGKYFIFVKNFDDDSKEKEILKLKFENQRLQRELQLKIEELEETKMLVTIYESNNKLTTQFQNELS
jgi:hypothetical protein